MPRFHSALWLGFGMLAFAALLTLFLIPTWVVTPSNVRILVLSPDFWPYIIAGMLAIGGVAMLLNYCLSALPW
jgi:putative tricarboxylic transport membrane protein